MRGTFFARSFFERLLGFRKDRRYPVRQPRSASLRDFCDRSVMNSHRCQACDFIFLGEDVPEEHCPECGEDWGVGAGAEVSENFETIESSLHPHLEEKSLLENNPLESITQEPLPRKAGGRIAFFVCLLIMVFSLVWQMRTTSLMKNSERTSQQRIKELEEELEATRSRLNDASLQIVDGRETTQEMTRQLEDVQQEFEDERRKFAADRVRLEELERSLSALWEQHGHSHLRSWQIIGPFPFAVASAETSDTTELAQLMAVETGILESGYSEQAKYVGLRPNLSWQPYLSDNDRIDLRKACDYSENAAAFAINWVFSRTPKEALLSVGSDDGMRLWFNRNLIHDVDTNRSSSPGQEKLPVTLKAGWNEVLVRVDNRGKGDWNFFAEFKTPDNKSGIKLFHTWIAPQSDVGLNDEKDQSDKSR